MTSKSDDLKHSKLAQALEDAAKELRTKDTVVQLTFPIKLPLYASLWLMPGESRLDVDQAAEALNLSKHAIYGLVARGALPRSKILGKLVFTATGLRAFLKQYE